VVFITFRYTDGFDDLGEVGFSTSTIVVVEKVLSYFPVPETIEAETFDENPECFRKYGLLSKGSIRQKVEVQKLLFRIK